MNKPRIVIITYDWPPRNAIATHRPYSWARYWKEAGAEVVVLTAKKQPFDQPLDLHLPSPSGVRVIEAPYESPAGPFTFLLKSERLRRLAKVIKSAWKRNSHFVLDPRAPWRKAVQVHVTRLAQWADIVVSSFGPPATHLIGSDMKVANPGLFWLADYRDLWSQNRSVGDSIELLEEIRRSELKSVGAHADLLSAVSKDMVEKLECLMSKRVIYNPNGFDVDEEEVRRRLANPLDVPEPPLRIVYTGKIYEGFHDPKPVLDALVFLLQSGKIADGMITLDIYGSQVEPIEALAKDPRYASFIRFMGHVPRDRALDAQRCAWLLLLLESSSAEARGILTGKLYEYLTAGRPIICVGSRQDFEIGQILRTTGTGMVVDPKDYSNIPDLLMNTLKGGGLMAIYSPKTDEILKYSRRRLAYSLFRELIEHWRRQGN